MELIYQEQKEVEPVYEMYQKIFEDPEDFARYYFEEVYAFNEVLLAQEDQKIFEICSRLSGDRAGYSISQSRQ